MISSLKLSYYKRRLFKYFRSKMKYPSSKNIFFVVNLLYFQKSYVSPLICSYCLYFFIISEHVF